MRWEVIFTTLALIIAFSMATYEAIHWKDKWRINNPGSDRTMDVYSDTELEFIKQQRLE